MNKKLIISLSTIAAIVIIAIGATTAYFSNTETSSGNTFIAGAIDLKIDNECHLNGRVCSNGYWDGNPANGPCDCTWELMDLDGKAIFNFIDVKPGDDGEDTISLHVDTNPAWVCAEVSNVKQWENGCNVPESMVDDPETSCGDPGEGQGELWENLFFDIWMDDDCDNVLDEEELILIENAGASNIKWPIADSQTGGSPIRDACIGVAWYVPDEVGNIIQGDSVTGDITFSAYQARHNENFVCFPPPLYCGDNIVTPPEQCELPGETNCSDCDQSTSQCVGPKLQIRDPFGDCDGNCGCIKDPWGPLACNKQTCDAACESDEDCPTNYVCTDGCSCEYVPSCGNGTLDSGEQCDDGNTTPLDGCSATCTLEPTITIHKDVVNNGVGTKNPSNFQMTIDGNDAAQDTAIYVSTGSHTVSEVDTFGYDKTYSESCPDGAVTLADDEDITCTVTNTYPYFTVTVNKVLINDNGGNAGIGDFSLFVGAYGVTSGVSKNVAVGTYLISESGVNGYAATFSGDCDPNTQLLTGASGETKTCTITNDDIAPVITLVKSVVGGSALPTDFIMRVDTIPVPSGGSKSVTSNAGHTITEDAKAGYHFTSMTGTGSQGSVCPTSLGGTVTLNEGEVITCTITNTSD